MLRTVVHVHVLDEAPAKTVLGEHAFHHTDEEGMHAGLDVLVEALFHENLGGELTLTAGIAGEVEVDAISHLLAGKAYFVGIDDDNVVAAFHERRIAGFVFAAENFGNLGAKTTENLVGGIDYDPVMLHGLSIGSRGFVA